MLYCIDMGVLQAPIKTCITVCVNGLLYQCICYLQLAKQHKCQFFETSAWVNTNIMEAFTTLAEQILNKVSFF